MTERRSQKTGGAALPKDFFFDQRTVSKLVIATKPTVAKCTLTMRGPGVQYVDVNLGLAPMWNWGVTYPPADSVEDRQMTVSVKSPSGPQLYSL